MKRNFNIIIRVVFTFVLAYFLFNSIRIIYDVNEAQKETEEVSEALEAEEEAVAKLKYRYEMPVDEEYITRVAKENNYYFPNEIIFFNNFSK